MIYYVAIATFLFIGSFVKMPRVHYWVSMLLLFFFTALRNVNLGGTDAISYQYFFNELVPTIDGFSQYKGRYELGYAFLNSFSKTLTDEYVVFQILYSALAIGLLSIVINNLKLNDRERCLFLFVYFCYRFYLNNFVLLRQNIANLIIWIIILKVLDKRALSNLGVLFTGLFHRTSFINLIMLPLINRMRVINKKKMLIITALISFFSIVMSNQLINKLVSMFAIVAGDKYSKYLIDGDAAVGFNVINYVLRWIVILFVYFYYDRIKNEKKEILLFTGLFAIIIGSFNHEIFTRMIEYYMIAIYGGITISHQIFSKNSKFIFYFIIYTIFMIILIRSLMLTSGGMFLNYEFFFNVQ